MRTLVDFLNHGALPFTGREGELERLLSFWRSTPEANGLRALLLVGEAGIGKSRLIEELIPRINRSGGLVVHTKLLPESTASVAPLIARALWYSEAGRHLLKKEPEDNLGSVLAGLRRLARLRPTLLVVEDIHLLHGETVGELWQLLDGLADETLSILCDARPLDLEARALLERYLVEEIELEGLGGAELERLWRAMFDAPADAPMLAMLADATAGNPLAVRSALRGALASGAIARDGNASPVRFDRGRFEAGLKRDVGLLTEGMAAHLAPEERAAASRLALLGEAFARETALAMLGEDGGEMIDRLIFRGILGIAPTPSAPLVGCSSEIPHYPATRSPLLSFSHTLVHRYFADRAQPDASSLLRIIGSDLPLYSLLPFQHLLAAGGGEELDDELLRLAIMRTRYVALELANSPDWREAEGIWEIASRLGERFGPRWAPEARRELESGLMTVKLTLLGNGEVGEEYRALATRLLELSASPRTTQDATRRIVALAKYHALDLDAPDLSRTLWNESEELVASFPDLRFTHSYGLFLALTASSAIAGRDDEVARLVEGRLNEIAADERGRQIGAHMRGWIMASCVTVFATPEELRERLALLEELEHTIEGSQQDLMLRMGKLLLLDAIGHVDELLRSVEQSLPRFREYNWVISFHKAQLMRLRALAAIGMPLEDAEAAAARLLVDVPEKTLATARPVIGAYLAEAGILMGDGEFARAIIEKYPEGWEIMENLPSLLARMELGELPESLPSHVPAGDRAGHDLLRLLEMARAAVGSAVRNGTPNAEDVQTLGRGMLRRPILQTSHLLYLHATLRLLEMAAPERSAALEEATSDALLRGLEWLAERRLPRYMPPLLERYERHASAKEAKAWRARMATAARERKAQLAEAKGDGRIRLAMLGTIAVEIPGEAPARVQGARLRTVLGLMVANQMMEAPLSGREFYQIAAGEESPEKARNVVYVKLHALREMLGAEALITETDQAPRLDPARVQVDLLDAHALLAEARSAMRDGALLRAYPALLRALELTHGEVPFPGLYEEFFEAAREDFENALRTTTITVLKGLLREDDAQSAEEIARRAFEAMPDDEELADLLADALVRRGKRMEAERVRRRAALEL